MNYNKPHFIIKNNLQKSKKTGKYFKDFVTIDVLKDVCFRITGINDFSYDYVDNNYCDEFISSTYNKVRLAILKYKDQVMYISFSEKDITGRNSSVQSVPTAFNMFYLNKYKNKRLYYYFLDADGNVETDYLILMYRLMKTIGFEFLNEEVLGEKVNAFISIEDIMFSRYVNSGHNKSNNSTYITKSSNKHIDIYGKTYGANKYETSMICYAISLLAKKNQIITLYEVLEKNLKELPVTSLNIIRKMGKINIVPTNMQLEKKLLLENNSLRSPRYIYNLFNRLGTKKCALCECEIPEIIQGAHIWPVASIKKTNLLSFEEKLEHAISGDNGIWLCENHHKLFDENIIMISKHGKIKFSNNLEKKHIIYLNSITTKYTLPNKYMTNKFVKYLSLRNKVM